MKRIHKLTREVRQLKSEVRHIRRAIDRSNRMDKLIASMQQSARDMLLLSREL